MRNYSNSAPIAIAHRHRSNRFLFSIEFNLVSQPVFVESLNARVEQNAYLHRQKHPSTNGKLALAASGCFFGSGIRAPSAE